MQRHKLSVQRHNSPVQRHNLSVQLHNSFVQRHNPFVQRHNSSVQRHKSPVQQHKRSVQRHILSVKPPDLVVQHPLEHSKPHENSGLHQKPCFRLVFGGIEERGGVSSLDLSMRWEQSRVASWTAPALWRFGRLKMWQPANMPLCSRAADEDSGQKDQHAAQRHLQHGGNQRRVHEAMAYPGDHAQFHQHHDHGDGDGHVQV